MYADPLKNFLEVIGEKAIGRILRVVAIFLDIRLRFFAHELSSYASETWARGTPDTKLSQSTEVLVLAIILPTNSFVN